METVELKTLIEKFRETLKDEDQLRMFDSIVNEIGQLNFDSSSQSVADKIKLNNWTYRATDVFSKIMLELLKHKVAGEALHLLEKLWEHFGD